ncbi:ECF subfamily RNA polymerase sigma-24 factor [Nostoc carneum NIES-2107]|nr:ECF subfamily RNA polymerase sigma-24 factor [Nostoc carneum NIES-2107]
MVVSPAVFSSSERSGSDDFSMTFWQQWQQYRDYLYRCCVKWMGGNPTDAEDALSRAMLKAWKKAQKYAEEISNFKAWLVTLTRNLCVDILRERSRGANRVENIEIYASGEEQGLVAFENTPESVMEADERKMVIRRAIDNLPTRLRETFILHFYQELSYPEIAQQQDISYQNVCKRISQSRKILQQELRGYFIGEGGTDRDKSVTPTATKSEIGEISLGNEGVEARAEETVLEVVIEVVENAVGEESLEVVCDVQQSKLVIVAATSEGKLEVRSNGCWCVEVVPWRQQRHQVGKVAGEFMLVLVRSSRSPPLYRLPDFQI